MGVVLTEWTKDQLGTCSLTVDGNVIRLENFHKDNASALLHHKVPQDFPWNMCVRTSVHVTGNIISFGIGFGGLSAFLGYGLRQMNWQTNQIGLSTGMGFVGLIDTSRQLSRNDQSIFVGSRYPFIFSPEGALRFTDRYFSGLERHLYIQVVGGHGGMCEFTAPELFTDTDGSAVKVIHWSEFSQFIPPIPLGDVSLGGKNFDDLQLAIINLEPKHLHIYFDKALGDSKIHREYVHLLESQQRRLGFTLEKNLVITPEKQNRTLGEVSPTNPTMYGEVVEGDNT